MRRVPSVAWLLLVLALTLTGGCYEPYRYEPAYCYPAYSRPVSAPCYCTPTPQGCCTPTTSYSPPCTPSAAPANYRPTLPPAQQQQPQSIGQQPAAQIPPPNYGR